MTELFGTESCQHTHELRDDLEWEGRVFTEYDVEKDEKALRRMMALTDGNRIVPVLVEDGIVMQIGLNGRGCIVSLPAPSDGAQL